MSLRKRLNLKFNRAKEFEDVLHYFQILFQEDDMWSRLDECDDAVPWRHHWWDRPEPYGTCHNMEDYYAFHLLKLLIKLDVNSAKESSKDRGWL